MSNLLAAIAAIAEMPDAHAEITRAELASAYAEVLEIAREAMAILEERS
jgi:hypothetical protein